MYINYSSLDALSSDRYPKYICNVCIKELYKIHDFRNKCRDTLKELDKLMASNNNDVIIKVDIMEPSVDINPAKKAKLVQKPSRYRTIYPKPPEPQEKSPYADIVLMQDDDGEENNQDCENLIPLTISIQSESISNNVQQFFVCSVCKIGFVSPIDLNNHLETHIERNKNYVCPFCFKVFNNKHAMGMHLRVHPVKKKM